MKLRYLFVILLFLMTDSLVAQYKVIPFTINKNNRMIMDYCIKGIQGRFFFDTGSNANILSDEFADKIGIEYDRDNCVPAYSLDRFPMLIHFSHYMDSIFSYSTNVEKDTDFNVYDDNLDGLIGIPRIQRGILDIDFRHSQLRFWDSIPKNFFTKKEIFVLPLVRADDGFENKLSMDCSILPLAIKGQMVVADSNVIAVNYILDSGVREFAFITVFDSTLFDKMIRYKRVISLKYGNNYPTIRLQIDGLHIDTLLANVSTMKDITEKDRVRPRIGTNKVAVNLGMKFMMMYDNVMIDRNNKKVYFVKSIENIEQKSTRYNTR